MGIHSKLNLKFLVCLSLIVNGIFLMRMLLSHSESAKLVSANFLEPPGLSQRMSGPGKPINIIVNYPSNCYRCMGIDRHT